MPTGPGTSLDRAYRPIRVVFRLLATGMLRADAGSIRFLGEEVTQLSAAQRARRGLARSFQITAVIPGFTALENAALAAQAHAGSSFRFLRPAAASRARVEGGLVVYPGAWVDTDVMFKSTPTHVDEYLYLRSPRAPGRSPG